MAKNTCNCPNPPGGTVECESHQIAVCQVKDGKAIYRCINPSIKPKRVGELKYEGDEAIQLVYRITGDSSFLTEKNLSKALGILKSGIYINNETNEITTFNLPIDW